MRDFGEFICEIVIIASVVGLCYVFFKIGQLHPIHGHEETTVEVVVR